MSVCAAAEEDSGSEEPPAAAARQLHQEKAASKLVRVLTVLAYLLSVSLAAILLSVYYVYVWQSPALPPEPAARRLLDHGHLHAEEHEPDGQRSFYQGGSNSSMRMNTTQEAPSNDAGFVASDDDFSSDPPTASTSTYDTNSTNVT